MLFVISPAKSLDAQAPSLPGHSQPELLPHSQDLVSELRQLDKADLQNLMGISEALAKLNAERFQQFRPPFGPDNASTALLTFKGDVYQGLGAADFGEAELAYAQRHLRILSGLYGVLRPLDLMQPYRLEMGTRLATPAGKNLYDFWGGRITEALNAAIAEGGHRVLVNLASQEYFKAVRPAALAVPVLDIDFKEQRPDGYKIISFNAKKARGLMCRFAIQQRLSEPEQLKAFDAEGYFFNPDLSSPSHWVFTR